MREYKPYLVVWNLVAPEADVQVLEQAVYDLSEGRCLQLLENCWILRMPYSAEDAYLVLREHLSDEDDIFLIETVPPQSKFGLAPVPHYFGALAVDWQAVQQLLLDDWSDAGVDDGA